MQAIKFHNFSDEVFVCKYDGVPHTFNPGETMYLEDFKANHFAKHLIDRELDKKGINTGDVVSRNAMLTKCFVTEEVVPKDEVVGEVKKKEVKGKKKVVEFEDLQEEVIEE